MERESQLEGGKYSFINEVASEVVGKIGGRPTTEAGMKAARILAYRIMRERDHRYSHCDRDLPLILTMIQQPTFMEEEMELYEHTTTFVERFDRRNFQTSTNSLGLGVRQLA
jgi:hypothetical protein